MNKLKRTISFVLTIAVLCGTFYINTGAKESTGDSLLYTDAVGRLYGLGIIDSLVQNTGEPMTRANFLFTLMNALGFRNLGTDIERYKIANALGIINTETLNDPDGAITYEQAIKMLVGALGYGEYAEQNGGYPVGYIMVALNNKITAGLKSGIGSMLTRGEALIMIDNVLEANTMRPRYGQKDSYVIDRENTILRANLRIEKLRVVINNVDVVKGRIKADGKVYDVSEKVDLNAVPEGYATIYIDKDKDFVYWIEIDRDSEVIWDFIYGVNDSTEDVAYKVGDIRTLYLRNMDAKYSLSNNVIVEYNGKPFDEPQVLINKFVKAIVQDDEIVSLKIYPLSEGGLIYRANPDEIGFTRGEINELIMKGFSRVQELTVVVDGKASQNMYDLKNDMVFDYWTDETNDKYVIVASSRRINSRLTGISADALAFEDGTECEVSTQYGLYLFDEISRRFKLSISSHTFLNRKVTAYVDDNKYIRYIRLSDTEEKSNEFYGVVMATEEKAFGRRRIKIYSVSGAPGEAIYDVAKNFDKQSPISFEFAASVARDLDGRGFFKFGLNAKGEINRIENVPYFGNRFEKTTEFPWDETKFIDSLYVEGAVIFAILEVEGKFTVRRLYMSDLTSTKTYDGSPVTITSDFNIFENPIPRFVMLTGGVSKLRVGSTIGNLRVVEQIRKVDNDKYKVTLRNANNLTTYEVSSDFVEKYNLRPQTVVYVHTKQFELADRMSIALNSDNTPRIYDFSGNSKFDTFTGTNRTGFFEADEVLFRDYYAIQFRVNGEPQAPMMIYDEVNVYRVTANGKIYFDFNFGVTPALASETSYNRRRAAVVAIQPGTKCWFTLRYDNNRKRTTVGDIFYLDE